MNHNHHLTCSCEHEHKHHNSHSHGDECPESSCGCGHSHSHDSNTNKNAICFLVVASVAFVVALLPIPYIGKVILFAVSALLAGYDLFFSGIKELCKLRLEENALLLIAVVASFILGEFPEACIVTILFKLGSFIEATAISRSKKSMEALTKIRPDYATIKNEHGEFISVKAETVSIEDTIYLRAGDRVPLDCVIIDGNSTIDSSALTGEALPIYVQSGNELMSGSVNLTGILTCKVIKSFENSTASQIIDLVYSSSKKKGKAENFISHFAKIYTPIVVILAVIISVVPPLFGFGSFDDFIMRGLIFLVASCPCSLVISIPLAFSCAVGASSKIGILVKGSMYIEKLAKTDAVCMDKTGTITSGALTVDTIMTLSNYTTDEVLTIAANIESASTHPIAVSIVDFAKNYDKIKLTEHKEIAGLGLSAKLNGNNILCGGKKLLVSHGIDTTSLPNANIYICENENVIGYITIKEEIPDTSLSIADSLNGVGVSRVVMLTGDNQANAEAIAEKCHISEYYSGLLPVDKVNKVEYVKTSNANVLFVGDGINDAPVLASADLGVSMGLGSEIANATSDVILASNNLSALPKAIKLAKRSMKIVYFNIIFAIVIKLIVLTLGAMDLGSMWFAVFADIGVTILSVLNSIRILRFK